MMSLPKQIEANSYGAAIDAGALWSFETARYTVAFFALEEDADPADLMDNNNEIERIRNSSNPAGWFCAAIGVYDEHGKLIGSDYLGACSYGSFREFYSDHRNSNQAHRNCSVQQWYSRKDGRKLKSPRRTKYVVCHYFPGMVREAISEAKAHELTKQFVAA